MTAPARRLHVVDSETHEILDGCPECAAKDDEIKGLVRSLKAESRRLEELRRDKEAEARDSHHWPMALLIFQAWQQATGHTRAAWTADRFFVVEPFLRKKEYGPEVCLRAVAGIAFDHFNVQRKNGSTRHFDEFERPFKDAASLEERANAAPKGWREAEPFVSALERVGALNASAPHPKARR